MEKHKKISPAELTEIIYDRMTELMDLAWAMYFTVTGHDEGEEDEWETTGEFCELDDDSLAF